MVLKLPQIGGTAYQRPGRYDPANPWDPQHLQRDFARRDAEFKRVDLENFKKNQNVEIFPPQQLILHSPNGGSWPVIVNDAGQITAAGGPPWMAELQYVERSSDFTVTTTSTPIISAAAQVVPAGYTIDAALEAYIPTVDVGNNATFSAMIRVNGTDQGIIVLIDPKGAQLLMPVFAVRRLTLPAGTYTFELAVVKTGAADVLVHAGPGGAGAYLPAFLRLLATIHQ